MRFRFWHRPSDPAPTPPPARVPRPRQSWENGPTEVFPTLDPGRAGNLTRGQRWRAGGRRNDRSGW
ncbi:hypothetical protein ACFY2R_09060 [Micromonospora olivasterospora]|uniref:Uncharacterized protein n=1 Tax=Micromonospora olivasterospora TaxID=1880 RepID=A0A562IEA8_MICOL|nr:hypothetical protein [Micromonospora olivasterospora]TWH69347.1 hypothetical protein JD77_04356 [Micromonospora olivasterospora]